MYSTPLNAIAAGIHGEKENHRNQKLYSTCYLTQNPSSSMVMQIQHLECAESTS